MMNAGAIQEIAKAWLGSRGRARRMPYAGFRRLLAIAAAVALVSMALVSVSLNGAPPAAADTAPTDPTNPATPPTVSADALPTVQVNGVVWQQAIIGNTVYAVGSFSTARPAGAAPGTSTVTRSNILAYDLTSGALITSFAPALNAQALTIKASPDGSRLYVGGDFTAVNGASVWRVAALNPSTGALITSFVPKMSSSVRAIALVGNTVYLGGLFNAVGTVNRARLAAFSATDGSLLSWAPTADNGKVNALMPSPDGTEIVVGGAFTSLNGSASPGYGLGAVSATTGALVVPFAVNSTVRDAGANSAITSLTGDANNVYGTGYVFGSGGNLEGSFSASWSNGSIKWIEDCHGDTYALYPSDSVAYAVGHPHYCGNIGGFPQTNPSSWHRALAFGKEPTGVITKDFLGYADFSGNPSPSLLDWFPDLDTGTYTGQNQGPWTVTGNSQYVVLGGEFLHVNNTAQQGLVRFAVRSTAPNKQGPMVTGSHLDPRVTSPASGTVRISWVADWDRDNENLKYQLIRDSNTASPVYTATQPSRFYNLAPMGYLDTGLAPGSVHTYRLQVTDPLGNTVKSDTVSVTVASSGSLSAYASRVFSDGAGNYWRLGETSGSTVTDWAGTTDAVAGSGVTGGVPGAIAKDSNTASSFNGTSSGYASTQSSTNGPNVFTAEAWFRTTSTSGGKILGFGSSSSGNSSYYDRHIYMDNSGRIFFGVDQSGVRTLNTSQSYNDGAWHHVAAVLGPSGMQLYVDGTQAGQRTDTTAGQPFYGFWRIGGDSLAGWPSAPASNYFNGSIDEAAVYPVALGSQAIAAHFQLGSSGASANTAPTASFTASTSGLSVSVDGSGSNDPDGTIASYAWNFGDSATATGPTANHTYAAAGTYTVTLTVTDNGGATNSTSKSVTVSAPAQGSTLAQDAFGRTLSSGLGTADTGGPWTLNGSASYFSVANGTGNIILSKAGLGPSAYLGAVSSSSTDTQATVSEDKLANGGGSIVGLTGRRVGTSGEYRAKVKLSATGAVTLQATRVAAGTETTLQQAAVAGLTYAAGQQLQLRVQVTGTAPTTIRAKVWATGSTEPAAWQVSVTDATASLQSAGSVGILAYLSGSTTNFPVTARFDNLLASTL